MTRNSDCLFCMIASRQAAADVVFEDEDVIAFRDIHPKYPVHVLVVPKQHVASAAALSAEDDQRAGKLLRVGAELAHQEGLVESGFRLVANTGPNAGQVVQHLHVHLLGGQPLRPL